MFLSNPPLPKICAACIKLKVLNLSLKKKLIVRVCTIIHDQSQNIVHNLLIMSHLISNIQYLILLYCKISLVSTKILN